MLLSNQSRATDQWNRSLMDPRNTEYVGMSSFCFSSSPFLEAWAGCFTTPLARATPTFSSTAPTVTVTCATRRMTSSQEPSNLAVTHQDSNTCFTSTLTTWRRS
eukprot:GHVL01031510.1.p3 GENE.GHVL01031510.1~~GHVL01031510.1.p3  ORF type:complete len:104 (+),score=4.83 GHVL01031510.1:308-619(+)